MEVRRYKVTSFKEIPGSTDVRVLMENASAIRFKSKDPNMSVKEMMLDPGRFAQDLMSKSINNLIRDTFLISREEYEKKLYDIGDFVLVTIEKE